MDFDKNHKKKKKKPISRIKIYRRSVQISVAILFIIIPWLNSRHISFVYGNFLSFNLAGIPLADPLAVLQIILKNACFSADLITGAFIALGIAMLAGTVFCSWICPFGLLSDMAQGLSRRFSRKFSSTSRQKRDGENCQTEPQNGIASESSSTMQRNNATRFNLNGFKIKSCITVAGLALFMLFSTTPVLNQFSMPAWYSRIFQFIFTQQHISFAIGIIFFILLLETCIKKKIWCRYLCPQSVLLVLVKQLNPRRMKIGFNTENCLHPMAGKEQCRKACTLSLDPKNFSSRFETECMNCGDCIVACSKAGQALKFTFKK